MNFLKKILIIFSKKDVFKAAWLFVGMIVLGLLEVVGVVSIMPFMAIVSSPQIVEENVYINFLYVSGGFDNQSSFTVFLGFVMLSVIILTNCYSAFMKWKITYFVRMQGYLLEVRLLKYYLSQPYVFFLNRSTPDMEKNILTEIERFAGGIVHPGLEAISKIVVISFIFILLVIVDPVVAFGVLFVLGGSYISLFLFINKRQKAIGVETVKAIKKRYTLVNQIMSGVKEVKLREIEEAYVKRYAVPAYNYSNYLAQNLLVAQLPRYALETLAFGSLIVIIIISILRGNSGADIMPMLSLYAFAGYRLLPSLQTVFSNLTKFKFHLPILNNLVDDFVNYRSVDFGKSSEKLNLKKEIELSKVSYTYPNAHKPSLDQLNLIINPNTTVGIVGSSGAGKTTLVDIFLGLLNIDSGNFRVDGIDITPHNLQAWRNGAGYIPQSIYLTDDTIAANIAFGINKDDVNFEDIIKAGKLAMLDQFVNTLPDGYMTVIGERGVRLSGGQRQRIVIARALYNDPSLLIMDEATSSLDGITEDIVMESINNMAHQKTIIIIAHRITTVKECDIIHIMDNGRIIDSGTYKHLLKNNIRFRNMAKV